MEVNKLRASCSLRNVLMSSSLAGEDFDQRIMEYFIKLIKKKHSKDISGDKRALGKLRREAERAKRALSNQHQVNSRMLRPLPDKRTQNTQMHFFILGPRRN